MSLLANGPAPFMGWGDVAFSVAFFLGLALLWLWLAFGERLSSFVWRYVVPTTWLGWLRLGIAYLVLLLLGLCFVVNVVWPLSET